MKKKLLALCLAVALLLGMLPSVGAAGTGELAGHWAAEAVQTWVDRGVITGDSRGLRPDDPVTRGEMAKILAEVLGLPEASENPFTDLDSQWYTPYVLRCAAAGILQGDSSGAARPRDSITRQEAFVMLARAFGVAGEAVCGTVFSDGDQTASWAREQINAMVNRDYIHGSGGKLRPLDCITRAEILTVLDNLVSLYLQTPGVTVDLSGVTGFVIVAAEDVRLLHGENCTIIIQSGLKSGEDAAGDTVCRTHISSTRNCAQADYCLICGALLRPAGEHSYTAETIEPTCTEYGCTRYTCQVCGDSYEEDIVPALGHDYEKTVVPPTSVHTGYDLYTCTRCGHSYRDGETRLFLVIYACDALPEGMTNGAVTTDRALYSDAAVASVGSPLLEGAFAAVDAEAYAADGVVHLYVYAEDGAAAGTLTVTLNGASWDAGTLADGWNELWLPVEDAQGEIDWSCVNRVSLTVSGQTEQTFLTDQIEIWHSADLPWANRGQMIYDCDTAANLSRTVTQEEEPTLPTELAQKHTSAEHNTSAVGARCFLYITIEPVDISAYTEDGWVHFYLYLGDLSAMPTSGVTRLELTSSGTWDSNSLRWNLEDYTTLQAGWNELWLPFDKGTTPIAGSELNPSAVNFVRVYTTAEHGAALTAMVDNIEILHESELPQNAATHDDQAVRLAAARIQGINQIEVRIPAGSDRQTAVESALTKRVNEALEGAEHIYGVTFAVSYDGQSGTAEIVFSKNDASRVKQVAVTIVEYTIGARLVTPQYDDSEQIVAEIVMGEAGSAYELDSTGTEDVTQAIQNALDECAAAGGGTVWLPAGRYRITGSLKIPAYVTLRGDYQDPDSVENPAYGTILLADVDSMSEGNLEPLIRVGGSAGAVGLTVYYPDQSMDQVKDYQYTFYTEGRGDGRPDQMLPTIRNCTLINAYRGVGLCDHLDGTLVASYSQEQATLINIKGTFLSNMLTERNGSDVGTVIGLTASSRYWANAGAGLTRADAAAIEAYTRANGTAIVFGDLECYTFSDITVENYAVGIRTYIEKGARAHFYGGLYRLRITGCGTALQLDNVFPGDSVNIAASTLEGSDYSIRKTTADGSVKLTDVTLTGPVEGAGIVTADNDAADLDGLWRDYYAQPRKPAARLTVLDSLDKTGAQDVSGEIQAALDSLSGGGIVYLPAGHYRLDQPLTIPAGVELRGATSSTQVRPEREADGGTVLEIRHGYDANDTTQAAIRLNGDGAGVNGLILVYRDQTTLADTYRQTAWAVYGKDVKDVYVCNSAIVAPSHGILLEHCDGHLLQGLTTSCYENIITIRNSTGGSIQRVLQNVTLTARNAWGWEDWTTGTEGLALTAENLDCLVFENADETVFAYFDYRGHNTFLSKDSDLTVLNSGSGGDSTGYIFTVDGGKVLGVNITSTRTARKPLKMLNQPEVRLYSRSTRGNMAERAFVSPDWARLGQEIYVFQDCDGQIPATGVQALVSEPSKAGGAWQLGGGKTLLSQMLTELDMTPFAGGAIHLWVYSETGTKEPMTFLLSSSGTANKAYACWPISHLEAGWNEIWLPLADVENQTGGLDLTCVNYMEITAVSTSLSVVVDEIGLAPAALAKDHLTESEQSKTIHSCDTALHGISKVITQAEAPEGVTLKTEKALLHDSTHNGTAETRVIMQGILSPVDLSAYAADGWLHFWLYIEDASQLGKGFTRFSLNSSNAYDSANQIRWHLENFMTLESGWNEVWLPLGKAEVLGTGVDLSNINGMRLITTDVHGSICFILDQVEVVHKGYVPQSVLQPAPTKMIMSCDLAVAFSTLNGMTVTSEAGTFVQGNGALTASTWTTVVGSGVFATPVDIKDYDSGYLHVSLYVEDVTKLGSTVNLELTSSGKNDAQEKEFVVSKSALQNGWNDLWFSIPATGGSGAINLEAVNFFRLFSVGGGSTTVRLDNVYAALEKGS